MEEMDLVSRTRLIHDQRRVKVCLTRRSRALAARMAPQVEETYRRVERRLGEGFFKRLYTELDELIARLSD